MKRIVHNYDTDKLERKVKEYVDKELDTTGTFVQYAYDFVSLQTELKIIVHKRIVTIGINYKDKSLSLEEFLESIVKPCCVFMDSIGYKLTDSHVTED